MYFIFSYESEPIGCKGRPEIAALVGDSSELKSAPETKILRGAEGGQSVGSSRVKVMPVRRPQT